MVDDRPSLEHPVDRRVREPDPALGVEDEDRLGHGVEDRAELGQGAGRGLHGRGRRAWREAPERFVAPRRA